MRLIKCKNKKKLLNELLAAFKKNNIKIEIILII